MPRHSTTRADGTSRRTSQPTAWSLWSRWLVTVTLAEALGFLVPAAVGAMLVDAPDTTMALALVAAGLVEGTFLGAGQAAVARRMLPGLPMVRFVALTAVAAAFAYAIAMVPVLLGPRLTDLPWRCRCVGPAGRRELAALARRADAYAIGSRVRFTGARTGQRLAATYASADVLVLATRAESYGMVVTEALAHGLPVLATAAGGLPEALGRLPDGRVPGVLVPPDDADALAAALRRWLTDDGHRGALRDAAAERRASLDGWGVTTDRVGRVLEEAAR